MVRNLRLQRATRSAYRKFSGARSWNPIEHGFRILSAYTTRAGEKIWILTEADRSATTILLPEEY